jgi:hypothetical protein
VQQRDNVFGVKIITDKEPCLGDVDLEEGYITTGETWRASADLSEKYFTSRKTRWERSVHRLRHLQESTAVPAAVAA